MITFLLVTGAVTAQAAPSAVTAQAAGQCTFMWPNGGDRDKLSAELLHYADGRLASHERPRRIVFVDALPMTPSGKAQRHLLRDDVLSAIPPG